MARNAIIIKPKDLDVIKAREILGDRLYEKHECSYYLKEDNYKFSNELNEISLAYFIDNHLKYLIHNINSIIKRPKNIISYNTLIPFCTIDKLNNGEYCITSLILEDNFYQFWLIESNTKQLYKLRKTLIINYAKAYIECIKSIIKSLELNDYTVCYLTYCR